MRAPAVPNFPNPQPGVTGFASSQSQATSSQTGYEAASEPGLLPIRTPLFGRLVEPPRTPETSTSYYTFVDCEPSPALGYALQGTRAQELTLFRPRPSSFPAPGKSGGGAGSGARGYGGGARPRAPGPRSRYGQAPPPLQGPGYSPQRCSSAT